MKSMLKPWMVLAVIFIAGGLSGAALTMALNAHSPHRFDPGKMRMHWKEDLTRKLNLTPDQQAKLDPILSDAEAKLQTARREQFDTFNAIFRDTDAKIAELLTPEQKTLQQQMIADREKMAASHRWGGPPHHHDGGPNGENPPPPPPSGPSGSAPAPPPPQGNPPPSGA
jgi:Spy/CpxP family protein refolding chaperone